MLMLDHKGISYELSELVTGAHPMILRMRGFPGSPVPIREVDGGTHRALALLDRLGTVPALAMGTERVQTNRRIARFLDGAQATPSLFPADAPLRAAVEQAEIWGDEVLQMAARRIVLAAAARSLDELHDRANSGRLGALLAPGERQRMVAGSIAARFAFRASAMSERELISQLPSMLERVDAWIESGVLDGSELNAADFIIAPSIALLSYRHDLRESIASRPAGALIDRVLPMS
jgi:glutathione S-transferase